MKKIYAFIVALFIVLNAMAQSNPNPFDLSTGNYSFSSWDSLTNTAGTFPSNMVFHTVAAQTPDENTVANGDWNCAYNLNTGCYFKGRDTLGVSFRNIGNSQGAACMANGTGTSIYVGDATLALNTTNRENVTVNWLGRMISSFNYSDSAQITRFWGIACQYRVSDTTAFVNAGPDYLFKCNIDTITYQPQFYTDSFNIVLPTDCNDQPIVQVRWVYHQLAQNAGGPRPELAIDDINVSSTSIPTSIKKNTPVKTLHVYPNPISGGIVSLTKICNFTVLDVLGHQLINFQLGKDFNTDNLSKGIYFIKTTEGEVVRFVKQ